MGIVELLEIIKSIKYQANGLSEEKYDLSRRIRIRLCSRRTNQRKARNFRPRRRARRENRLRFVVSAVDVVGFE